MNSISGKKSIKREIVILFICLLLIFSTQSTTGKNDGVINQQNNKKFHSLNFSSILSSEKNIQFLRVGSRIRTYRIHIPPSYDGTKPVPLLLVLHGYTGNSKLMKKIVGFDEKADEEGFIVVYPNGGTDILFMLGCRITKNRWGFYWNSGFIPGIAFRRNIDDVGYIKELIVHLQSEFSINSSRIYVTGHSNGGMMSYRIASDLSDIIAAIAPVSGTSGGRYIKFLPFYVTPKPENPVSIIAFHGMKDETVPYEGNAKYFSVNQSISLWVEYNNCDLVPKINISQSKNIITRTYTNESKSSEVKLYTVVNGTHEWFGSKNSPISEISTTDIIWDFFEEHPKR